MNPAEATAALSFHQQWSQDELRVEKGFSADTLNLLKVKGKNIAEKASMGRPKTIQVRNGEFWGYSDPRNQDGKTLGY